MFIIQHVFNTVARVVTFPLEPLRAIFDTKRAIQAIPNDQTCKIYIDGNTRHMYVNGEHVKTYELKPLPQQITDIARSMFRIESDD